MLIDEVLEYDDNYTQTAENSTELRGTCFDQDFKNCDYIIKDAQQKGQCDTPTAKTKLVQRVMCEKGTTWRAKPDQLRQCNRRTAQRKNVTARTV